MKKLTYGTIAGLLTVLALLPLGVEAQQTIRNITILAMPADATELPAAAALADNTANPTVPAVGAFLMCYDGSTWDRCVVSQDVTHDSAAGTTGPQLMGEMDDTSTDVVDEGDAGRLRIDAYRRLKTIESNPCADWTRISNVAVDSAASGNVELVALTASSIVYVCGYDLVADAAVAVQFIYGTGAACGTGETDLSGPMSFAANGGISRPVTGVVQFANAVSNALCIENSGTGGIRGSVQYVKTATP